MDLSNSISFGFEQTFTIPNWWEKEGFCNVSDTAFKREKMLELANNLASELGGSILESKDEWEHIQFEVLKNKKTFFYITMDPGSIEVKTIPKYRSELVEYITPLFLAAEKSGLVPYRNWWYGVKKGTEGGCHVNMGAKEQNPNPFNENPDLLVKYAAYLHNRPFLAYPFMGVDVGPGGNAQRIDEKKDEVSTRKLFKDYPIGKFKSLDEVYTYFEDSSLITDRSSFPSFRKFKSPLNMIEDRAQEALRSPEEFLLVIDLRLKILQYLQKQESIENLESFPSLHAEELTSFKLWERFQYWANTLEINPVPYQVFFERQFPKISHGDNSPKKFSLREGRKPREVLEVYKNKQGEITGKKVDTSLKRIELYYSTLTEEQFRFEVNGEELQFSSEPMRHNGYLGFGEAGSSYFQYFDIKASDDNPLIKISLIDKLTLNQLETVCFDINSMSFVDCPE